MSQFAYTNGILHAEGNSLEGLAQSIRTPFYCYSTAALTHNFQAFENAFNQRDSLVCFAVKANPNLAVINTLSSLGAGADVVSEGELRRALAGGVPADKIVFSGVGKTREELGYALDKRILQINVESLSELKLLSEIACDHGVEAEIAVRVNPDVDAVTHEKITTGRQENKFGIDISAAEGIYEYASSLPGIRPTAVAMHIGSQLVDLDPFRTAFKRLRELVLSLGGAGYQIRRIDLGGGLGVSYNRETYDIPGPELYAQVVNEVLGDIDCTLMFEPGRVISGNAGVLVTKVIYVKKGEGRNFVIVDAAMNDLIRPALYDAQHDIQPVRLPQTDACTQFYDIVGPVCETGDTFARQVAMAEIMEGDHLAINAAGAYGASMSSTYNSRCLVPEILVHGSDFAIVRKRPSYEEMFSLEQFADWQD